MGPLSAPEARPDARNDEAALWEAAKTQGSAEARTALFERYQPLARSVAHRQLRLHTCGDLEFPDLLQLANTGLLEAIDGYDLQHGVSFARYGVKRITGAVLDGIGKTNEMREQIAFRRRLRAERLRSLAPDADPDALDAGAAMKALADLAVGLALGFMLEDSGMVQTDPDAQAPANAYQSLAWKEVVQRVAAEVASLPPRQKAVIRHHYLDDLSFEEVGVRLGFSQQRASQLHAEALALLRKRLCAAGHFRLER